MLCMYVYYFCMQVIRRLSDLDDSDEIVVMDNKSASRCSNTVFRWLSCCHGSTIDA